MENFFESLFYPKRKFDFELQNDIRYYNSERDGDQFQVEDISAWIDGGIFKRRWDNRGHPNQYANDVYFSLCKEAAELALPIVDIASGPGLGLLPDILSINPDTKTLATDACPKVVEKWSQFLRQQKSIESVDFASFSVNHIPFHSNSVPVITSNLGFSSLRYAGPDQVNGINEAFRVLKPGGYIFAIENEFADMQVVRKVFDLWGRENWFKNNELNWSQRFRRAGFTIESEMPHLTRIENADWEFGEVAAGFGLDLVVKFTAYKLRKISAEKIAEFPE